jgi:hypothetical protein
MGKTVNKWVSGVTFPFWLLFQVETEEPLSLQDRNALDGNGRRFEQTGLLRQICLLLVFVGLCFGVRARHSNAVAAG